MGWGIWKKIKNAFSTAGKWIHNKILKPVGNFAKNVVKKVAAPIISAKGKILKTSGDIIGQVAPGEYYIVTDTTYNNRLSDTAEFLKNKGVKNGYGR